MRRRPSSCSWCSLPARMERPPPPGPRVPSTAASRVPSSPGAVEDLARSWSPGYRRRPRGTRREKTTLAHLSPVPARALRRPRPAAARSLSPAGAGRRPATSIVVVRDGRGARTGSRCCPPPSRQDRAAAGPLRRLAPARSRLAGRRRLGSSCPTRTVGSRTAATPPPARVSDNGTLRAWKAWAPDPAPSTPCKSARPRWNGRRPGTECGASSLQYRVGEVRTVFRGEALDCAAT